jgi:uncharacterized protein with von Willebrand factor type A (vWA) domain
MSEQGSQLPLIELFTRLRQADVPLGVDDYQVFLHALQAGFGLADREALARLCRMVWIKSQEHEALFSYHFDQVLPAAATAEQSRADAKPCGPDPQDDETLLSSQRPQRPASVSVPEVVFSQKDQAVQAVLHAASETELPYPRFVRSDEYFPVTRRQLKESWRYLRRPVREGPRTEVDIAATLHEIGRTGILLEPVLIPPRINRAELLLLIDQGGSMVPFQALSHRLVASALRGGRTEEVAVYYFRNCPADYLYRDPAHRGAVALQEILNRPRSDSCGAVIFSDAGAARRSFNPQRCELTGRFLARCAGCFRSIVWLNPTPRTRWAGTTAGSIRQLVPMFDISRRGLDAAVGSLRRRRQGCAMKMEAGQHE